jgi:hypothetical protein
MRWRPQERFVFEKDRLLMEEQFTTDATGQDAAASPPQLDETTAVYTGRWHRLVSTTNWEKGRIICGWRQALIDSGAASGLYSDDAWSQRVGGVSPQHVGRLRRVFERFGLVVAQFQGLFWSHFHAALDWDDAEMWLEGAVQNQWSVAGMRQKRWETLGSVPDVKPQEQDALDAEPDEDTAGDDAPPETIAGSLGEVQDPDADQSGAGLDEPQVVPFDEPQLVGDEPAAAVPAFQPFAQLPSLPDDLAEAFEAFKVAIVNHRLAGWKEISRGDVIAALDALKQLAVAPAGE